MNLNKHFQNTVLFSFCFFLIVIITGTISLMLNITIGNSANKSFFVLLSFFMVFSLMLILRGCFRRIENMDEKSLYSTTLFIFAMMAGIYFILLYSFDIRPQTDEYHVIDTAAYLLDNPRFMPDNLHSGSLGIFKNNYTLVLMYSQFIRFLFWFGIKNILIPIRMLNVACIMGSFLLTWLITKDVRGIRAAVKVILLCALNPLAYGLTFWAYSNTFSMPIMMGIIYAAVRFHKAPKTLRACIWYGIIEGILFVLGYEIRVTAIFPVFAIVICVLQQMMTDTSNLQIKIYKKYKPIFVLALVMCCVTVIGFAGINHIKATHFKDVYYMNYPISYWLMMGSHGSGGISTNADDLVFMRETGNSFEAAMRETINNYREMGVSGTLTFWYRMIVNTWADGYSSINERMKAGQNNLFLWQLTSGPQRHLFRLYAQSFRLIIVFGDLLCGIFVLKQERKSKIIWMLILTMAGAFLFYLFWEKKDVYSAPFLPIMFILAEVGFSRSTVQLKARQPELKDKILLRNFYAIGTVLVCFILYNVTSSEGNFEYIILEGIFNTDVVSPVADDDSPCNIIEQDFYTKQEFNELIIMAEETETPKEFSSYRITISDSRKTALFEQVVDSSQIVGYGFNLTFPAIRGDTHYYVTITKLEPQKKNVVFYTRYSYYLDSYKGRLSVDEDENYTDDLAMNVMKIYEGEYFNIKQRAAVIFVILLIGLSNCIEIRYLEK